MKKIIISDALDFVLPAYIEEAVIFAPPGDGKSKAWKRRIITAALVAALLAALAAAASAAGFFTIKDMEVTHPEGWGPPAANSSGPKETVNYTAEEEWDKYLATRRWGENEMEAGQEDGIYESYRAYSPEAKAALDEILTRHDLKLYQYKISPLDGAEGLCEYAGVENFMPPRGESEYSPSPGAGYYEGGSFEIGDIALLEDGRSIPYDFYRHVNGYFHRGHDLIIDPEMEEWSYTCSDGTEVRIGLGGHQSIITAELENSFIFVHIRSGRDNSNPDKNAYWFPTVNKADLEAFADSINYAVLDSIK